MKKYALWLFLILVQQIYSMQKEENLIYKKPTVDDLINYLEDYWG